MDLTVHMLNQTAVSVKVCFVSLKSERVKIERPCLGDKYS